jgi:selenocysteine-specific elongation factor
VRVDEAELLTGVRAHGAARVGPWLVRDDVVGAVERAVLEQLESFHAERPLEEGAALAVARDAVAVALRAAAAPTDRELVEALLDELHSRGILVRTASTIRSAAHRVALEAASEDVTALLEEIGGDREAAPPSIKDLIARGFRKDVIDAASRAGVVVKVGSDLVFAPSFVERAEELVRSAADTGITVSAFREGLGTSRKYALPLLEWFDQRGLTRRSGDLRFPREKGLP